ncbi:MAG TPA: polysaccharide deacetylase family protein [Candidatus Saccharimonadales bacterium]|nr:polysaccharide deacetylase family protein [Candidatus Saccharimonadales bacterium]
MKKKLGRAARWAKRPQLVAALVALGLVAVSQLFTNRGGPGGLEPVLPANAPYSATADVKAPLSHIDCAKIPCINISFDDGPNPVTTPQILTILEQNHVRANFFVVGLRAAAMPQILQREYQDGHEIGNHSWSHPDLTTLSREQVQAQVLQTQAAVVAAGVPAPRLFRPPYGAMNPMVKSQIHMTLAMWNVDPEDWGSKDPAKLAERVIATAKPGGVIDMHDIDAATVTALPAILQNLKERFQFVTMSQMFNLAPNQHGEFFGR